MVLAFQAPPNSRGGLAWRPNGSEQSSLLELLPGYLWSEKGLLSSKDPKGTKMCHPSLMPGATNWIIEPISVYAPICPSLISLPATFAHQYAWLQWKYNRTFSHSWYGLKKVFSNIAKKFLFHLINFQKVAKSLTNLNLPSFFFFLYEYLYLIDYVRFEGTVYLSIGNGMFKTFENLPDIYPS